MTWIGGSLFLAFVLVPVIKSPELEKVYPVLFQKAGKRFRVVGWISLGILIITGMLQIDFRGYSPSFMQTALGKVLALKLFLVLVIIVLTLLHDLWIGGKAVELSKQDPGSRETGKFRSWAKWLGRLNLIFGVIVVFLAVVLVRGV
jgi:uncharacterized membrane protein